MEEYDRLEEIHNKIIMDTALSGELEEFLHLIVKSGNEAEMLSYMRVLGFFSIEEIVQHLTQEKKNEGISTGLAIAGGAILLAALLSK
ncbi:MAG: hypothetical protein Ctma_1532 [Catillopecten margaritatus gill symbiont]|uniref:Nif11 domain-containing protein n=1 Tax=Catillopecten margaritatus gill symbiont TaxID=3083288 RepID=A0AAU6PIG3_9GAMM